MTLLTIVIFGIMALIVSAWIIAELEVKAAEHDKLFEIMFMRVQFILRLEPTEKRMNELLSLIKQLEKWDNGEKVNKVKTDFFLNYKRLSDELLSQDEFEPEVIFGKTKHYERQTNY